jgi:hypothetical protein
LIHLILLFTSFFATYRLHPHHKNYLNIYNDNVHMYLNV